MHEGNKKAQYYIFQMESEQFHMVLNECSVGLASDIVLLNGT